jgi:hypothetical protein
VNRREIYARITLVDGLPSPCKITLYAAGVVATMPCITLVFDTLDEGAQWVERLGGSPELRLNSDGYTYLRHGLIEWLGCDVLIHAHQKLDDGPALDEATREQLQQLVDGFASELDAVTDAIASAAVELLDEADRVLVDEEVGDRAGRALSGSQQELVDEALGEPLRHLHIVRTAAERAGLLAHPCVGSSPGLPLGEVYDREEPEPDGKPLPDGVTGFPVGSGPRRGLPFADLGPSTVVIRG